MPVFDQWFHLWVLLCCFVLDGGAVSGRKLPLDFLFTFWELFERRRKNDDGKWLNEVGVNRKFSISRLIFETWPFDTRPCVCVYSWMLFFPSLSFFSLTSLSLQIFLCLFFFLTIEPRTSRKNLRIKKNLIAHALIIFSMNAWTVPSWWQALWAVIVYIVLLLPRLPKGHVVMDYIPLLERCITFTCPQKICIHMKTANLLWST